MVGIMIENPHYDIYNWTTIAKCKSNKLGASKLV